MIQKWKTAGDAVRSRPFYSALGLRAGMRSVYDFSGRFLLARKRTRADRTITVAAAFSADLRRLGEDGQRALAATAQSLSPHDPRSPGPSTRPHEHVRRR